MIALTASLPVFNEILSQFMPAVPENPNFLTFVIWMLHCFVSIPLPFPALDGNGILWIPLYVAIIAFALIGFAIKFYSAVVGGSFK